MNIYQIYTKYLVRKWMALVTDNQAAYDHAIHHLVRIENMYRRYDQDNFYHFRRMVADRFTRKDGKVIVK